MTIADLRAIANASNEPMHAPHEYRAYMRELLVLYDAQGELLQAERMRRCVPTGSQAFNYDAVSRL